MTTLTRPPGDRVTVKASFGATARRRRTDRRIASDLGKPENGAVGKLGGT